MYPKTNQVLFRTTAILLLAAAATAAAMAGCQRRQTLTRAADSPTTIVLISIDTLRADAVTFAADASPQRTPFLSSLAAKGVQFSRAYATSPWTAPSMASMLTGLYPHTHGIRRGMISRNAEVKRQAVVRQPVLSESIDTLAEKLNAAGFATVGVAANMHLSESLGFRQGFDQYARAAFVDASEVNESAMELLRATYGSDWSTRWRQQPTFLWLHYFDPHMPYQARRPWISSYAPEYATNPQLYPDNMDTPEVHKHYRHTDEEGYARLRALYWSEVSYVDEQLRQLNEVLHFDDPNVLVIVTADHGEEFGEHGGIGHATSLFEELVHIPLLVRWPARFPQAATRDNLVSLIDIYPTLLRLVGIPGTSQGQALPLDGDGPATRSLYVENDRSGDPQSAVIDADWKFIRRMSRKKREPEYRLLDLRGDPGERRDVQAQQPEVAARMKDALSGLDQLPAAGSGEMVPVGDDATNQRLHQLGYD